MTHALIVEDNANNLAILAELLDSEGVSYTQILKPNQLDSAIEKLPKTDLIFLDLELPGVDGFTLLEQLRANPRFHDTPFIAHTVHTNQINVARKLGFHSFLSKPLDPDRFSDQLTRILSGERVWAAY
ncbi:MAG: response regulator [Chloroflexota bacterium]|nr:response regulator [Chloroflexota bacterium]